MSDPEKPREVKTEAPKTPPEAKAEGAPGANAEDTSGASPMPPPASQPPKAKITITRDIGAARPVPGFSGPVTKDTHHANACGFSVVGFQWTALLGFNKVVFDDAGMKEVAGTVVEMPWPLLAALHVEIGELLAIHAESQGTIELPKSYKEGKGIK